MGIDNYSLIRASLFVTIFAIATLCGARYTESHAKHYRKITPSDSIVLYLKNFMIFEGRTSRAAFYYGLIIGYCIFFLGNIGIGFIVGFLFEDLTEPDVAIASIFISAALYFAFIIPISVRRLHDCNKSGWNLLWCLTGFGTAYVWFLHAKQGTVGDNIYGADQDTGHTNTQQPPEKVQVLPLGKREDDQLKKDDPSWVKTMKGINYAGPYAYADGEADMVTTPDLIKNIDVTGTPVSTLNADPDERRDCPECAELIIMNAKKCRFCGADAAL